MDSEQAAGRLDHLWWLPAILVLVAGLVITALVAPQSREPVDDLAAELSRGRHDQLRHHLTRRATGTFSAADDFVADELLSSNAVTIRPITGSGVTSKPADFRQAAREFLARFPGVAGVEHLITVDHSQRPMMERRLSIEDDQYIRFGEWKNHFNVEPAAPADQYLIVRHAEFQQGSTAAEASLGLVAPSVIHWRGALQKALGLQRPAATTVTGVQRNGDRLSALRVFFPAGDDQLLAVVIEPQPWLETQLDAFNGLTGEVEIHDISQHASQPLAFVPADEPLATDLPALRSTLDFVDRQWMLTTRPTSSWIEPFQEQALWPAWLIGLATTLLASGFCLWAGLRASQVRHLLDHRTTRLQRLGRKLDNTRVEKNILHHSLRESDQRTRDFIELCAGIYGELDEARHIGYISSHVTQLLERPSADLIDRPLDDLIPTRLHADLAMAFDAARRDHAIQRLDTALVTADDEELPVALRIKTLKDPLSGCAGFRVSLTPRQ